MANDSLDFVQRGKVSIVRRQYAEAVKICRLGLLAHPTLLEGRLVLGMALTALQRWDEVLAEMRVALEVDGQSALAWLLKGEALVGKGDYVQAEASLKRAKELDPSNSKADQLLAEIQVARAAGFEGIPAEPTDTKVYPAKAGDDARLADEVAPFGAGGELPETTGEAEVEYSDEDTTEVDPDPSGRLEMLKPPAPAASSQRPPAVILEPDLAPNLADDQDDPSTETFVPGKSGSESSYEPPASDDYAERARPRVPSLSPPLSEEPSIPGLETRTPIELHRPYRGLPSLAGADGKVRAPAPGDATEPSIELSGSDLLSATQEREFDVSDEEYDDEETYQRNRRQVDENAGTTPEAPEPVVKRARPLRPFDPSPEAARARVSPTAALPAYSSHDAPTGLTESPTLDPKGDRTGTPGVVRVPVGRVERPARPPRAQPPFWTRVRWALVGDRGGGLALLATALVAVIAVGVVTGLVVREWRMRARVAKRYELARQKLQSGNYPGFEAAELLYRQILAERDDPLARALRARTLAQMTFEFGDASDPASRAVASLGALDSAEANEARTYLALARGELDRGARMATALRRKAADPMGSYLVGRAELLLEHPDAAVDALKAATDQQPRDPLFWHGLGLAQAAAHHDALAKSAYERALGLNSNHIATLIDRAVLEVRSGSPADRDQARAQLDGVTTKLVGDSSPGQLARAFLAIGELELASGELDGARRALASAVAKRRDGDALLSEELARAFLRAFQLDQAEKEAKRAVAGFGSSPRLEPRLVLAEVALARGRAQKALTTIDEAGTSRPDALVLRALANLQLGRRDAARFDAESALRVQPDLVAAKVALARVEIADGHADRALRELGALERTTPKRSEVASALGMASAARAPERAKVWFNEALKRDPLAIEPRLQLARLYRAGGNLDDARAQLDAILQESPEYAPAQRERAAIALDEGDTVAARDQYDALIEKEPDFDTLLGAARAHLALGELASAQDRANRAAQMAPNSLAAEEANDLAARALLAARKPAEASALLRKIAPTAQRGETGGLLLLAYLDLDQQDKAAEVRLIVPPRLRLAPEMLMARARLQIERGRDVAAESLALAALAKLNRPNASRWVKAESLTVLGRSRWEQGSFGAALKSLHAACTLEPKSARAFYYLGMVLEEVGKRADARAAMETAVANDGQFSDALYNLGYFRQEAGDPKAADAYRRYLEVAPKGIYADDARRAIANQGKVKPTSSPPRKRRRGR